MCMFRELLMLGRFVQAWWLARLHSVAMCQALFCTIRTGVVGQEVTHKPEIIAVGFLFASCALVHNRSS